MWVIHNQRPEYEYISYSKFLILIILGTIKVTIKILNFPALLAPSFGLGLI